MSRHPSIALELDVESETGVVGPGGAIPEESLPWSKDRGPNQPLSGSEMADAELVASKIDKPSDPKRWLVLFLATLAIFGPYYVFDNPAGTQQTLKENFNVPLMVNASTTAAVNATVAQFNLNFNLLYSLYSLPNTVRRAEYTACRMGPFNYLCSSCH
jgi:hypothetical protein